MHLKRRNNWPPGVSALDALNDYTWQRHLAEKSLLKCIVYKSKALIFRSKPKPHYIFREHSL